MPEKLSAFTFNHVYFVDRVFNVSSTARTRIGFVKIVTPQTESDFRPGSDRLLTRAYAFNERRYIFDETVRSANLDDRKNLVNHFGTLG